MTIEERLNFHEQFLASIERNVAVLVEAQQKTEARLDTVVELVGVLVRTAQSHQNALGEVFEVLRRLADEDDRLALRQQEYEQRQAEADRRGAESDRRLDRLAETLQRLLDSQQGRNGNQ